MSEKQIDLDAMRALAEKLSHASNWRTCDCPNCSGRRLLRTAADEIEQLRKDWEERNHRVGELADEKRKVLQRRDDLITEIEQLRKERDALRAFIQSETDACTKSHLGGPCGACARRIAALAAQGDKPHDR